jgi:hypothetical protein
MARYLINFVIDRRMSDFQSISSNSAKWIPNCCLFRSAYICNSQRQLYSTRGCFSGTFLSRFLCFTKCSEAKWSLSRRAYAPNQHFVHSINGVDNLNNWWNGKKCWADVKLWKSFPFSSPRLHLKQFVRYHAAWLATVLIVVCVAAQLALEHHVAVGKLITAVRIVVVLYHVDAWVVRCRFFWHGKLMKNCKNEKWKRPKSAYLSSHECYSSAVRTVYPDICTSMTPSICSLWRPTPGI